MLSSEFSPRLTFTLRLSVVLLTLVAMMVGPHLRHVRASVPSPVIHQMVPSTLAAGGPDFMLTVRGSGFQPGSIVLWNGAARAATFNKYSQEMIAVIPASDITQPGTARVTVRNPD